MTCMIYISTGLPIKCDHIRTTPGRGQVSPLRALSGTHGLDQATISFDMIVCMRLTRMYSTAAARIRYLTDGMDEVARTAT